MGIVVKKEHSTSYTITYGVEFVSKSLIAIIQNDSRNGYSEEVIKVSKEDWPSFFKLISRANDIIMDDKKEGE